MSQERPVVVPFLWALVKRHVAQTDEATEKLGWLLRPPLGAALASKWPAEQARLEPVLEAIAVQLDRAELSVLLKIAALGYVAAALAIPTAERTTVLGWLVEELAVVEGPEP